jgi:hypothetical protein
MQPARTSQLRERGKMPELTSEERQLLQQLNERERVVSGPQRPRANQK